MLVTLLTTGTRGDTQPYIALGVELKKMGYQVRVAAFENFGALVKNYDLEFFPIRGDVSQVTVSPNGVDAMQADNPLKFLSSFGKLQSLVFDLQKDFFNACRGSDAIVYHPGATIGYFAAHDLGIPSILATPFPMSPTRDFPALIFYDLPRLGGTFNWLTHKLFEQVMWFASSSPIKKFWQTEFHSPPANFSNPFSKPATQTLPTIISCSDYVFPSSKDWSPFVYNTGYWFLDDQVGWTPPRALTDFLAAGTPPIYVGFGSTGDPAIAQQTTEFVIEALKQSGQRGILATGWSGMSKRADLPKDVFILESVPHSWLFPQMSAVIHHGGAGTTAVGFRAGVPTIIIPSGNDQFAWGRRAFELGVGAKPIPRKNLTAEKLAHAIRYSQNPNLQAAARKLGAKIQSENGAKVAAEIIVRCLARPSEQDRIRSSKGSRL